MCVECGLKTNACDPYNKCDDQTLPLETIGSLGNSLVASINVSLHVLFSFEMRTCETCEQNSSTNMLSVLQEVLCLVSSTAN